MFLFPPKKGRFDENSENAEFAFYPLETRASLLRPLKTTKMAGVTQARHGSESRVCSSLNFSSETVLSRQYSACLIKGMLKSAVKQRGRERKGPPKISQKFCLRDWPISSADFPSRLLWKGQSTILALFRRRISFSRPLCFTADFGAFHWGPPS